MSRNSSIDHLLKEVHSYSDLQDLEKLVEQVGDLSMIPAQPLYSLLKKTSTDMVGQYLDKLSKEQRTTMLDIDLWHKDNIDLQHFPFWMESYLKSNNAELIEELSVSEQFALYLKGVANIWTFDVDDPQYPDHDYYFLTEDNQILFEYSEDYPYSEHLKNLVRSLYGELGVEKAYSHLFKIVSDNFLSFQEEEYQRKISRLRDFGFVDYYDSLVLTNSFPSFPTMKREIEVKFKTNLKVSELEGKVANQALDKNSVEPFRHGGDEGSDFSAILDELSKVEDLKTQDFLRFNFIRLVNSSMSLSGALKESQTSLYRSGEQVKHYLHLAQDYLKQNYQEQIKDKSLFEFFDFFDLYKIAHTLISLKKKKITSALRKFDLFESSFLGEMFNHFYFDLQLAVPKNRVYLQDLSQTQLVQSWSVYQNWGHNVDFFSQLIPYISKLQKSFENLVKGQSLNDDHYINHKVNEIDFEVILLSSFANETLGNQDGKKFGLLSSEFKELMGVIAEGKELKPFEGLEGQLKAFASSRGLELDSIEHYLYHLLNYHLAGYDAEEIHESELKHVGGLLILKSTDSE
jgi:hypothetical protein